MRPQAHPCCISQDWRYRFAFLLYHITPLLIAEYAAGCKQVSVLHFQLVSVGTVINVLLQFVGNLTEDTFLADKVFCQCRTVSHVIIAYFVLMVDKFIKPVKPSLYDGLHFVADRRTLHFLYHAAFYVDFPQGHFTVYLKRQLIISYL